MRKPCRGRARGRGRGSERRDLPGQGLGADRPAGDVDQGDIASRMRNRTAPASARESQSETPETQNETSRTLQAAGSEPARAGARSVERAAVETCPRCRRACRLGRAREPENENGRER